MHISMKGTAKFIAAMVFACGIGAEANAVDIRSWDQRIDDATKRFVVLAAFNNQAVLDKETQLVWQRQTASPQTWYVAMEGCLLASIGGRDGWRLPSMSELSSLVGPSGVLPAGHPFTGLLVNAHYWSSTSSYYTTSAYLRALTFDHGTTGGKSYANASLCVRGPGSPDRF